MTIKPISGRILVTGSSGLLGCALIDELKRHSDAGVFGLSSRNANLLDMTATMDAFETYRPEIVYHLAARVSGIMGNMRAQGLGYYENIMMNTNVVEAARQCGVRKIIAMGSSAIYSDQISLPMREDDVWNGPPHPAEAGYAHAKRSLLAQLEAYKDEYGLDFAYCISTNLFGPHDKFDEAHGHVIPSLLSKFRRAARNGGNVTVWGSGTPQRDFLYSRDAARAIRLIAENVSGPINLASGIAISIARAVETIERVSNLNGRVVWDRSKPDGQKLRAYDVSRLLAIGFKPSFTFEEALLETFSWLCENEAIARR